MSSAAEPPDDLAELAPPAVIPSLQLRADGTAPELFCDTSALVAVVPWDWCRCLIVLQDECHLRIRIPDSVRREYHDVWNRKLSRSLGSVGAEERPAFIESLEAPAAPSMQELLAIAVVVEIACSTIGVTRCAEAEAVGFALLRQGHVLINDLSDARTIREALRRASRSQEAFPEELRVAAHLWSGRKEDGLLSSSAAPLILVCEAGRYDIGEARNVTRLQGECGETPLPEMAKYVRARDDPRKRRQMLRRHPNYWRAFYAEGPGHGNGEAVREVASF